MALVVTGLWELMESPGAGFAARFSTSIHEATRCAGLGGPQPSLGGAAAPFAVLGTWASAPSRCFNVKLGVTG